jgi:hypothetical protein
MWVIGLLVLFGFIAFLVFAPPLKAETAEKLLEKSISNSDNDGGVNWLNNPSDDALASYNETRTNPVYSYLPDNIYHKD